jgi:hypothetical protein
VSPGSDGLNGPRGILFNEGGFLVANQNANLPIPGEILSYSGTGTFLKAFVASSDKNAPFAPRGIILRKQSDGPFRYVANISGNGSSLGRVNTYDAKGNFLAELKAPGFPSKEYHSRGIVFGPDGLLYVATRTLKIPQLGGWVLRFNPDGSFVDVFIACG